MTLREVERALARFGIGLPQDLLLALVQEAEGAGSLPTLVHRNAEAERSEFETFKARVHAQPWTPLAPLPVAWW